jgi:peroxiredoxin
MRNVAKFAATVAALTLLFGCDESLGKAKDFALVPLDDQAKSVKLADFKGKTVLLDFWATYCGPCKDSMPEIQAMWDKYHSKGFEVASISAEPRELVLAFHKATGFSFPVYLDPSARANDAYGVSSIPQYVLIRDGAIIWQQTGYKQGDIQAEIESVMG